MEKYTKYEKARILGARALQLSMNAPILINISKEKLEEVNYDPLKIAEIEFNSDILPITIKRPFPKKEEELEEESEDEVLKEETEVPAEKPEVVEEKAKVEEEEAEPIETESPELEI